MSQIAPTVASATPNSQSCASSVDELARVFNTALVATRGGTLRDFSSELYSLVQSAPFRAILSSVRQFARLQSISEREAAEAIIQTFRKIDRLWTDYIFHEGVDRLKDQSAPS